MASHVAARSGGAASTSATTVSSVRAMFVPVSPSGTGYTLSRLMLTSWSRTTSRKVVTVSRRVPTEKRSSGRSSVGITPLYGRVRSEPSIGTLEVLFAAGHGRVFSSRSK